MMKLYGSTTSPFVRRLRIWLSAVEHEFINMQIFDGPDREQLAAQNPAMKIPMLDDDGNVIFDSRVIYRYVSDKLKYPSPSWDQENQLTVIDAVNDSLVQILLLQRSNINTDDDKMYFRLQRERADISLLYLNEQVQQGQFDDWHYPSICLYCLIDWIEFRTLHDLSKMDHLKAFHRANHDRIEVTATDPRTS
ncbi:glutathione S-transferase family protein [Alteromonas oceanisediminis]|uniref:glutathione S-transferase family protein n=1 Tax=Alteromonas oceanisediminis TaxID=2836180 RepID=UPI001BD9566A|nr:glutathione S-transferase family protein [Alteromonas oceanisediminis]MBT0585249.1 glutathione S-transferase family protein [Alteromonas oceanisediminis]